MKHHSSETGYGTRSQRPRLSTLAAEDNAFGFTDTVPGSANKTTLLEPFVDAGQAAEFLRLHRRRLLQLARQGKLPAYPIGDGPRKVWRFRLSELAAAMLHSRQRSHVPEEI